MKSVNKVCRTFNALKSPLAVAALALLLATNLGLAARNPNPGIIKPEGQYKGTDYSEWAAQWWASIYSIPVVNGEHPLLTGGAFASQSEPNMMFLSAVPGGAEINVTIDSKTRLFFPVVNAECSVVESEPFHGDNEAEMRACANGHIDNTSDLAVTIDGAPVNSLQSYREESALFTFTLPENNVLAFLGEDAPPGTVSQSVDAGVYLLLSPLKPGTHTIEVTGTFDELGTTIDTTFRITVQ